MARPRRIVLVRHGESEGNADDTVYERVPDHALELTATGRRAGRRRPVKRLRELFGDERGQRLRLAVPAHPADVPGRSAWTRLIRVAEEPRLREQDWGNWQDREDVRAAEGATATRYGHFFYRFAQGESGADVYDRVGAFLESLYRELRGSPDHPPNVLLVTHGLTMRLFCMRWFHWTVAEFESLSNPGNGETRTLLLGDDGRYTLDRPFERWCDPRSPYGRHRLECAGR